MLREFVATRESPRAEGPIKKIVVPRQTDRVDGQTIIYKDFQLKKSKTHFSAAPNPPALSHI